MKVEIICPLYNAENYIINLNNSIKMQKKVNISKISYILTESSDNTEKILKENKINYKKIRKNEFSHSLTREKVAFNSKADIIVFITQDIVIKDDKWLFKLVKPIIDGNVEETYSRQISKYDNIEKYTREKNYPAVSIIKTKEKIDKYGLNTFFSSDAASAIKLSVFKKLNGYDNKDLPLSEDMYFSYKLIQNGYKIKYCASSVVYHSHNFTLKEVYDRYKLTGKFFRENKYLNNYKVNKSGSSLAIYIFKRALKEKNIKVLLRFPFDMGARLLGMKVGFRK